MADSDDESITLSSHALDALKQFYTERDTHAERFEKLKADAERNARSGEPISMEAFTEDWNESQFWYSDETATLLAKQLLAGATENSVIAVVSAPSVFVALKNLVAKSGPETPRPKMYLLEHDQRFSVFPEFVFYDFQQPLKLPAEMKGSVDQIVCDPPFLSEDCQTKAALTCRWMISSSRQPQVSSAPSSATDSPPRVIVCTGERMESLVTGRLYNAFGVRTTDFEPVHARGLSNEFYCYANFECEDWRWKDRTG